MPIRSPALVLLPLTAFAACEEKLRASDQCVLSPVGLTPSATACYRIPSAIHTGVLWPGRNDGAFTIVLHEDACRLQLLSTDERLLQVPAPGSGIGWWEEAPAHSWDLPTEVWPGERITINNRSGGSIDMRLPASENAYFLAVLRNPKGGEMLVFSNPSEGCTDRGFFGYVAFDRWLVNSER